MPNSNHGNKKLSALINKASTSGFSIDTSNDSELLSGQNYNWDDLNTLKGELGISILEFVGQVKLMLDNPDIVNNLGDQTKHFSDTIDIFFKDITNFSEKIRVIRDQHEMLSGPVTDLNQFSLYNRLAMNYHSLCNELTILIGPTISELILIVSKATDHTKVASNSEGMTNV